MPILASLFPFVTLPSLFLLSTTLPLLLPSSPPPVLPALVHSSFWAAEAVEWCYSDIVQDIERTRPLFPEEILAAESAAAAAGASPSNTSSDPSPTYLDHIDSNGYPKTEELKEYREVVKGGGDGDRERGEGGKSAERGPLIDGF
jgi:hypothetical protein